MIRKAFLMTLYAGQEEEYERRHNPIWPELEAKLKEHGAHNYSIFRHGLQLFAYVEIEDEARWDALAQTEVVKRWWAYMAPLMETHPDNSPVGIELKEVFHID
jgi:L-rhamnose mutarotase